MSIADKTRWKLDSKLVDPSGGQRNMAPHLPGHDGLPFRGVPYDRKENDPSSMQPQVGARVHVEVLNMSEPDDRKRMEDIYTMFTNGNAVISAEERQWDDEIKSWRVLLRWADVYTFNPQATKGHGNGHIS